MKTLAIGSVVATIEFEPADWSSRPYSHLLGTSSWAAFWAEELASLGLSPISAGSWFVSVEQIAQPRVIERLARVHLDGAGIVGFPSPDGDVGDDDDRVDAMMGGYALLAPNGDLVLEPGCCCDLGDYDFWRSFVDGDRQVDSPGSIGHADFDVLKSGDHLELHFLEHCPTRREAIRFPRADMARVLPMALDQVQRFHHRLSEQLACLLEPPSRASAISLLLLGQKSRAWT